MVAAGRSTLEQFLPHTPMLPRAFPLHSDVPPCRRFSLLPHSRQRGPNPRYPIGAHTLFHIRVCRRSTESLPVRKVLQPTDCTPLESCLGGTPRTYHKNAKRSSPRSMMISTTLDHTSLWSPSTCSMTTCKTPIGQKGSKPWKLGMSRGVPISSHSCRQGRAPVHACSGGKSKLERGTSGLHRYTELSGKCLGHQAPE